MPPTNHSILGASSAERWINCPGSVNATRFIPDKGSSYAAEGSLAHELCELYTRRALGLAIPADMTEENIRSNKYWSDEMISCAEGYRDYIIERAGHYVSPYVDLEVKVDYSHIAPGGFGTTDAVIIGEDRETGAMTIEIVDYKHGKGVPKFAPGNPQMRLYSLGAAHVYGFIYGEFELARSTIYQPRLDSVSFDETPMSELRQWAADTVRPAALEATSPDAHFSAGHWCQFCKIKGSCRERAKLYTSIEDDFKDVVTGEYRPPSTLSNDEIGEVLRRMDTISNYVTDVKEYVFDCISSGEEVPGWKLVAGRSTRSFTNVDEAFDAIKAAGVDEALLYERKPITLTACEKLLGKKMFAEVCEPYIHKPEGKPTLAPESDKRPALEMCGSAESDFKDFI